MNHRQVAGIQWIRQVRVIGNHLLRRQLPLVDEDPRGKTANVIHVPLQYQHPHRVYELVDSDQVDLGLVSYPRSSRTIKATPWREEPMVVVCSRRHKLAQRREVSLQELHGCDMVGFDQELEIRQEIDRALAESGAEVRVAMEFDNTETIKRAVEIDAGFSILPRPTVDREVEAGALVALPLAGATLNRPIGIIQRRGKELGKTATRFMQLLLAQPEMTPGDDDERPDDFEISGSEELAAANGNGSSAAAGKRVKA